jgi:ribosomal protein S18 acetylase RimI-like enzyme
MYDNQEGNYPYGYFVNNELVGKIKVTHSEDENFYGLSRFYVEKEFRNKGIGTKLLEFVINKYGNHDLVLNVAQNNIKALTLYKKHGFVITYIENNPKHGDKFYVMTRVELQK